MELDMSDVDLPEDYLSPRSKVARMLADIDEAPTPSPSPLKQASLRNTPDDNAQSRAVTDSLTRSRGQRSSPVTVSDDGSPTRPIGRAARRMLNQGHISDDELYSATPAKTRQSRHVTPAHLATASARLTVDRSPGLFVSPARSQDSDNLLDNPLSRPSRLAELVAAKRNERLARENATKRRSASASTSPARVSSDLPDEIVEDAADSARDANLEKILSDAARPTRKASKKAMRDMERETQRLAREQALAHQMKTKKKFTNTDLFARLNFRQAANQQDTNAPSSSAPNSDGVEAEERAPREPLSTPPSSPPTPWDTQKALVERGALARMVPVREDSISSLTNMPLDDDNDEFPEAHDLMRSSQHFRATQQPAQVSPSKAHTSRMRAKLRQLKAQQEDSDEEIDIIQPMPAHLKVFDRVKPVSKRGEVRSKAIHALKHLAHLTHDTATARGKKALKPVVATTTVNAQLIATAKAQARQAQQERLAELQAKGIVVMSAEEQEKEHDQFENLLEKARQEAEDLRKQEKAARRKQGDESKILASDDESEDEDWHESGSEDEEADVENEMIDEAAEESASDEESVHDDGDDELALDGTTAPLETPAGPKATRKPRIILEDDEDDDADPSASNTVSAPQEDDPFAAFGFDAMDGPDLMSPTQAFAATMQTPTQWTQGAHAARFHSTFEQPPRPTFGQVTSQDFLDDTASQLVPASQLQEHTQAINLDWETQLPETPITEAKSANMMETPGWEPSQDAGLPSPWTAARRGNLYIPHDEEHETQSTVPVRISESPEADAPRNRGRLTRGFRIVDSDDEEIAAPVKKSKNAFNEMQQRRMQTMNATDRAAAEKEMRDMMDDQAEESEDEYAGLGGDDSNMIAHENEEDRAAIDDSNIEINERDMQKFYADRQRAADEEATSKLFKDITTGALRRRQGVGWELDEDEDELAARRRQIRQREEARKRRLLLQDDNVKGLLEGRGNSKGREAFLRTIGDDDNQDDFLETMVPAVEESQQGSQPADGALREISNNKRPLELSQADLPQAKIRRTREDEGAFSRPTSMLQVRQSLSFLLDEPHSIIEPELPQEETTFDSQYDDDDPVGKESFRDNDGGYAPDLVRIQSQEMPPPPLPTDRLPAAQRRTPAKPAVIDRLSLRRGSSSSSSTSSMGWSAWSTGTTATSKAPSLLRRATSNLSASSNTNERGVSYSNANANDRGVSIGSARTGGSKKSSLAYQSRAQERKAIGQRAEKKKEENRRKVAEIRRQQGGALVNGIKSGQWE
ncbi:hypothetical protein AMS68_000077 [Peltaster fructicola]|uniref:DNA replication checkpoint mediator MRC1 domain-containing protein n=1 Tax=Peltaster fructicola TaxID=286661 RepID=A0A6H0XJ55_9PEZI|nr:hypothetical protein AMS68_000077 [Peltaster fructicola]